MIQDLDIGKAGEHIVIADLLLRGVKAFITDQNLPYDVVADCGTGNLMRLQVKTTRQIRKISQRANPIYFFHIKRTGKKNRKVYQRNDFDGFALVALDIREIFYLRFDERVKESSICIRDKKIDYSGHRGGGRINGLYYQDLTWEKLTKKIAEKIG